MNYKVIVFPTDEEKKKKNSVITNYFNCTDRKDVLSREKEALKRRGRCVMLLKI